MSFDYDALTIEELPQAFRLARILIDIYNPSSVIDVGCATGLYMVPFHAKDVWVYGYELSDVTDSAIISPRFIKQLDFTRDDLILHTSDLTLCLEVMEHIPETGADKAVNNLTKTSNKIIFSAAIPGQGGVGHINCQPKEYWVAKFKEVGYTRAEQEENDILTPLLAGYHMGWLRQNLMVFNKDEQ